MYGSNKAHLFSREYIQRITNITIQKNKRNGLPREVHLEKARMTIAFNKKYGLTTRKQQKSSKQENKIKNLFENIDVNNETINKSELAKKK